MVTTLETVVINRIEPIPSGVAFVPGNCWIVAIAFFLLLLLLHPPFHATTTLWPIVSILGQRVSWIFSSSLGTDVCAWLWGETRICWQRSKEALLTLGNWIPFTVVVYKYFDISIPLTSIQLIRS